jgi:C4-dicarboxylate-specific signal transduction histidine kinase
MAEPGSEPSEGAVLRATAEQALLRVDARLREISSFARAPAAAESCDVVATASTTLGLARCHRRCRQVEMTLEAPAEGSARVAMPAAELEQVLLNLLVNAADAMGQRGRTTIRVAPAERDGWDLLVEDEGPGIPPEQRREVLRPFFTTKPPGEGTGLGLAVCERLVLGRGGSLLIDASASGGASIRVRLPAVH